jgi:hypothetical protein
MPARVLVQPDVRHLRAQRHHAVPRRPVARRELPDRVDLPPTSRMCVEVGC